MAKAKGWAILLKDRRKFSRDFDGAVIIWPSKKAAEDDAHILDRVVRVEIRVRG